MTDKIMECITNPVKCKLLLEFYSQSQATAKHLSDTLGDIPQATLYRNLKSCTSRNSSLEAPSNTSPQNTFPGHRPYPLHEILLANWQLSCCPL